MITKEKMTPRQKIQHIIDKTEDDIKNYEEKKNGACELISNEYDEIIFQLELTKKALTDAVNCFD